MQVLEHTLAEATAFRENPTSHDPWMPYEPFEATNATDDDGAPSDGEDDGGNETDETADNDDVHEHSRGGGGRSDDVADVLGRLDGRGERAYNRVGDTVGVLAAEAATCNDSSTPSDPPPPVEMGKRMGDSEVATPAGAERAWITTVLSPAMEDTCGFADDGVRRGNGMATNGCADRRQGRTLASAARQSSGGLPGASGGTEPREPSTGSSPPAVSPPPPVQNGSARRESTSGSGSRRRRQKSKRGTAASVGTATDDRASDAVRF
mmetsp:Transcript_4171/g.10761  ORF Transcript_4171/g.10761 Transcript_4171/m.10761 type:complete len:265 (-) Transcript_4171:127-921(-)